MDAPADHKVKIKESEKIDKQLIIAEKQWNIKMVKISIVVGALRKVFKDLERSLEELEIKDKIDTI